MPNVGSRTLKAIKTGGTTFDPWVDVQAYNGGWQYAKKVFAHNGTAWVEVWNNRPVVVTGSGSSSAYDRITVTGTVDPNHFSSTPRFYYKKTSDSTYTADTSLTAVTGDGAQSVGSKTITGLVENTSYSYYLSATNDGGTDVGSVETVTTAVNCDQAAGGWTATNYPTCTECIDPDTSACGGCGTRYRYRTKYTKTGCTTYYSAWGAYGACNDSWVTVDPYNGPSSVVAGGVTYYSSVNGYTNNVGCGTGYSLEVYNISYCSSSGTYSATYAGCADFGV